MRIKPQNNASESRSLLNPQTARNIRLIAFSKAFTRWNLHLVRIYEQKTHRHLFSANDVVKTRNSARL
jgi:hypothetical protein